MKEGKYFYCRQLGHKTANFPKNITNAVTVAEIVGTAIDNTKKTEKE